jgi:hypothetical protein
MINDESEFNYWHDQMKGDAQFVQYMTELYKKQQLDIHVREPTNRRVTHHPCSPSVSSTQPRQKATRHLPQLMDQPISPSPIQVQPQFGHIRTTKTSTGYSKVQPNSQVSSTPRRPLDESVASEKQSHRQYKKSRPHESTPSEIPPTLAPSSSTSQFSFPPLHLKHAVSNNLPCFYIKFGDNTEQFQIPSIMKIAKWIRKTVQQQSTQPIDDFSLFAPAGVKRFKFGVTSKNDFLKLWNAKWPEEMNQMKIEIERPRSLPDCCALVVRYVPTELSDEYVIQEINKSTKSAVSFTQIKYHHPRPSKDYRFCVTDISEYEELLNIGRIAIGHVLLPITAFRPGLKMTYCTGCLELGHTRFQCKVGPRCRKCLETWEYNHKCQKPIMCAQCKGPHSSLSMECLVVQNYRRTLKDEVMNAVKGGLLRQSDEAHKSEKHHQMPSEFPQFKPAGGTRQAWGLLTGPSNDTQQQFKKEQLSELTCQINDVLNITRRLEAKIDNQIMKMEMLEKKSSINKQGIMVLANIMQQTINAISEKKNKQQLQSLSQQLEDFKTDIMEKVNVLTADQQATPISPSLQSNNNKITKLTTSNGNMNNNQVGKEPSMEITDDQ